MTSVVVSEDVAEKLNLDDVIRFTQKVEETEREKEKKKEEDGQYPTDPVSPPLPHSPVYRILILGAPGVGKTTLTHQLLTSEYLAANIEDASQGNSLLDYSYGTTFLSSKWRLLEIITQ